MTDLIPGLPRTTELVVNCHTDRPYFAEVPYFLWGAVDYTSTGDARFPSDREWRELTLIRRDTEALVEITPQPGAGRRVRLAVRALDSTLALRTAYFLTWRTDGQTTLGPDQPLQAHTDLAARLGDWDYEAAIARSVRVRKVFGRAELLPFDDMSFWPSWKWVGVPAIARNRVGRWIMDSVLRRDPRAVYLCVQWLHQGDALPPKTADALVYALARLTGEDHGDAPGWLAWYAAQGATRYPKPDFARWWAGVEHE